MYTVHIKGDWVLPNFLLAQLLRKSEDNYRTRLIGLGDFQPFYIQCLNACVCAKLPQSCSTLCDPMDCSPPGSSVHGILQARILERIACSPPGDLLDLGLEPVSVMSPTLAGEFFTTCATWEAHDA